MEYRKSGERVRTLRSHLEAREARVKELEQKMAEWEQKRKEAEETQARLSEAVGEVFSANGTSKLIYQTQTLLRLLSALLLYRLTNLFLSL